MPFFCKRWPRRNDRSSNPLMLYFSLYATFRRGLQSNPLETWRPARHAVEVAYSPDR